MAAPSLLSAQLALPLPGVAEVLPFPRRPDAVVPPLAMDRLHRRLGLLLGEPVDLVGTDNRRDLVTWSRDRDGLLCIRIQRQFAWAGEEVLHALAQLISMDDLQARRDVRAFAAGFDLRPRIRRGARVSPPQGKAHDLAKILDELDRTWFDGRFTGRIGWARSTRPPGRKRLRLGAWSAEDRMIRIHSTLDRAEVPAFVVAFIVFHEMLHAIIEPDDRNGRRIYHSSEFRIRERRHPDRVAAEAWLRDHVEVLWAPREGSPAT